ncbi:type II toxin-antitoxin system HicA family toxin [bacterium]|nr:type II toxin-antitoxin system HicA family toxin [bacterium]
MPGKKKKSGIGRVAPQKARILVKVFNKIGYHKTRQKGSHIIMRKENISRPLPIPNHPGEDVHPRMIERLYKQAGITREKYLQILSEL